ncbi:MAG TPA: pyridoxamine 5'-phosphate oxidase family protein [Candidatus Aminicenantes bacterium]|nr:pyridoxamine 5'-phosphate oxidase family protein [Candidatus Aminicenantes bacterium]
MTDLEKGIWGIIGRPRTAALATVGEDGAPWVRYVTVRAGKDFTLNFCTARSTRKARQIAARPDVHLTCGNLNPPDGSAYLQFAGRAEIRSDAEAKAAYWQEEWKRYFSGPEDPEYVIVLVRPAFIEYNAPGALEPEVWRNPTFDVSR